MAIDINELDIPVRLKFLEQVQGQLGQLGQRGNTVATDVQRSFERASTTTAALNRNTEVATRTFSRAAIGAQALAVSMQSGRVSAGGLASVLLTMGPAGGVGAAVLSGLALAATGMHLFTTNTRQAREEADELARSLDRFNELSTQQLENQRLVAVAEQAAIRFARQSATGYREATEAEARRLTELYNTIQRIDMLLAGRPAAGHYAPGSGGSTGRGGRSTPTRTDFFGVREGTVLRPGADASLMPDAATLVRLKQMADTWARINGSVADSAKVGRDFKAALEDAARSAEDLAEKLRQGNVAAIKGDVASRKGVAGDGMAGFAGAVASGNALGGMAAFASMLPAVGAAAQLVTPILADFAEQIFGGGEAARRAAEHARQLRESWDLTMRGAQARLSGDASAEAAIAAEIEFARLRQQARETAIAEAAAAANALESFRIMKVELPKTLAELADMEARRLRQLKVAEAERRKQLIEDLEVRRLRAMGADEQAEALAFAIQQQREYAEAVRSGADAALLATLAQVQMAERNRRIAELARETVAGLTSFRTSLMLGPQSALNPFAQYQEARRQYEDVLAAAQGGDRAAAGRLPEAARAFLDASRGINASGRAYARDFGRVQAETEELIRRFSNYAIEIEPEILNVSQHHLAEAQTQTAVLEEQNAHLAAAVAVLQAGFLQLLTKQDRVLFYADEQALQLRRLTAVT